jgi:hypothetical protein
MACAAILAAPKRPSLEQGLEQGLGTTTLSCVKKLREAKRRKAHANHWPRFKRGDASLRDAPAFRRLAAALPLAGLPPTGFNSGPRFLGRRPDAEQPAFPILQYSELLAGRSLCRPGGVRVARERTANPHAGTALAPHSGVPSRRRPSMSEIRWLCS